MATRQEVADALRQMLRTEEGAIPVYVQHINNSLFLSEFSAADRREIKAKLQILFVESQKHKAVIESLIRGVEEGGKNVY